MFIAKEQSKKNTRELIMPNNANFFSIKKNKSTNCVFTQIINDIVKYISPLYIYLYLIIVYVYSYSSFYE